MDFYAYEKEIDTLHYGHVFFAFLLPSKRTLGMLFVCGKKKLKVPTLCSENRQSKSNESAIRTGS